MKKRSLITNLILFFLTSTLIVSCFSGGNEVTTTTTTPEVATTDQETRLGFSAWPGWFPWQVSQDAGIFEQNQVNVILQWFDGYLESINALNVGQLDANSQTLGDTVNSISGGADQVIVLVNDNSTGNDKVIVREGINTIADLKGKTIAAEEGTVDHFLLLLGLKSAGLTPEDINFVPLETGQAATAFVGEQVDGVAVFAPFTTQALKRPNSKELFSSRDFPGAISDHLVVTRQFLEEHPAQVQALVDSWFATLDHIAANPEESYQIMADRAGVSLEEYKEYETGTRLFTLEENLKAFEPGNDLTFLPFAAQEMSKFLTEAGFTSSPTDTSRMFDDRFVKDYAARQTPAS